MQLIRFLEALCDQFQIQLRQFKSYEEFKSKFNELFDEKKVVGDSYLDIIDDEIAQSESFVKTQLATQEKLENDILRTRTEKQLLNIIKVYNYFEVSKANSFNSICGVIESSLVTRFTLALFRRTNGRHLLYMYQRKDVEEKTPHTLIIIFYRSGLNFSTMITKFAAAFMDFTFSIPKNINEEIDLVIKKQVDLTQLLEETKSNIESYLITKFTSDVSYLYIIKAFVVREKCTYSNIAKLQINQSGSYFAGTCWYPQSSEYNFPDVIRGIGEKIPGSSITVEQIQFKKRTPPSLFRKNEFLDEFQTIINIYGVPSYREINPLIIFSITFPFFFGVMFGDVCHGLVLVMIAVYLILSDKYLKLIKEKSFLKDLTGFKYILLIMGFFSVVCGFIYNEYASLPVVLRESCFSYTKGLTNAVRSLQCDFGIGMDSVWQTSLNGLEFINSFKMKLSIIFSFAHMLVGIVFHGINLSTHHKRMRLLLIFVPEILMFVCFVGYLSLIIIIKWNIDWTGITQTAPSLITTIMGFAINFGDVDSPLFANHAIMSKFFFYMFLIMIPITLLAYPIFQLCRDRSHKKYPQFKELNGNVKEAMDEHKEKQSPSCINIFSYHLVESIEFVLSIFSNTASYLRLWALSLAHMQLSEV